MNLQELLRNAKSQWARLENPRIILPAIAIVLLLSVVALSAQEQAPTIGTTSSTDEQGTGLPSEGSLESGAVASSTGAPTSAAIKGQKIETRSLAGPSILPADKTPLKIGFVVPSGDPARAFGGSSQSEDVPHLTRSMVKEINETGGIAGRPVEAFIKEVDQTDQGEATQSRLQNEACRSLTEDHKVFMVSGATLYTFKCYADHKTPMLELSALADDQDVKDYRPWLLPPPQALFSTVAHFAPDAWEQEGALTQKMGLLGFDVPALKRSARIAIPEIEERGGKVIDQRWSAVSYQDLGVVIGQAVLDFKRQGIDRVFYLAPGGGAWLAFARASDSQLYYPRHLLTSLDAPQGILDIFGPSFPESQLTGTIVASQRFVFDVSEKAFPLTDQEKKCFEVINKRAQTNYQSRAYGNGAYALGVCEILYLIRAALAPTTGKQLNPAAMPDRMNALGTSYKPVTWPQYRFGPGRADGAEVFGRAYYDQSGCKCFSYRNPAFYPIR